MFSRVAIPYSTDHVTSVVLPDTRINTEYHVTALAKKGLHCNLVRTPVVSPEFNSG